MAKPNESIPAPRLKMPMVDTKGVLTDAWARWIDLVYRRVGKDIALSNVELENLQQEDMADVAAALDSLEAATEGLENLTSLHSTEIAKLKADVEGLLLEPVA